MMRKLLSLFCTALLLATFANAQICTPDSQFTQAGIYPDSVTGLACAEVGVFYDQTITVVIPADTVADPGTGPIDFWIDSVELISITGFPTGIVNAGCSPTSCGWVGGTTGCLSAQGTANTPGTYVLTVITRSWVTDKATGFLSISQDDTLDWYSIEVVNAMVIDTNSVTTPSSCGNDGAIDISVTGGTGAGTYAYLWSNGSTTQDLTGLAGGTYSVTVTDSCFSKTLSVVVPSAGNPIQIDTSSSVTPVSTIGGNDGAINVTVTGGTPPYTFSWDNGESTEDIDTLIAGTYVLTVTDSAGCNSAVTLIVDQPVGIYEIKMAGISLVQNIPNPFTDKTDIQFNMPKAGSVNFSVHNLLGKVIYQEKIAAANGLNKFQFSSESIAPGIYIYTLKDNITTATGRMIISQK